MGIGLLRIVLAGCVLLTHSAYATALTIPGAVAVKLFYIISGFYMAMILCEKYPGHRGLYYRNRFLRLFPLYIATIFLIVLADAALAIMRAGGSTASFAILHAYRSGELTLGVVLFLLFSNLSMLFQDLVFFLGPDANGALAWASAEQLAGVPFYRFLLIPQAWSLSLEITFYAIAPFLIRRIDLIVPGLILSLAVRAAFFALGYEEEQFVYRFFPAELVFFLMGSLSYHAHRAARLRFLQDHERAILALILVAIGTYQLVPGPLEAVVRVGLYLAVAVAIPYVFQRSRHSALDNLIGELSYPFYIVHLFTFKILLWLAPRAGLDTQGVLFLLAWIAFTLLLSHAMIRIVQQPFDAVRMRPIAR